MTEERHDGQEQRESWEQWHEKDWRGSRLYRSRTDRMVAGVCGGLGELTGIDPNIVRLAWLFFILFGGTGLLAYLVMAIVVPERPGGEEGVRTAYSDHWRNMSRNGSLAVGAIVIVIGLLLLVNSLGWLPLGELWRLFWRLFWPLALICLGLLVVVGAFWGDRGWWRDVRLPASGKALRRSRSNRMLAGVCGGLADYFHVDPSLVRIIWAIGTLGTGGTGIVVYIVAALVLPEGE